MSVFHLTHYHTEVRHGRRDQQEIRGYKNMKVRTEHDFAIAAEKVPALPQLEAPFFLREGFRWKDWLTHDSESCSNQVLLEEAGYG